jgi:hypothetical protein
MTFSEFLTKQNSIYAEFRDISKIRTEGITPNVPDCKCGYTIVYRHPKNITDNISEFSRKINQIVPTINYDEINIHTSICSLKLTNKYNPEEIILKKLSDIVKSSLPLIKGVQINYTEWLIDQTSGIAGGDPNIKFFENMKNIIDHAESSDIELKSSWGAHITVSRFLNKVTCEQAAELLDLFKNSKPLGISLPNHIDVGYFVLTPESFKIEVYERFEI